MSSVLTIAEAAEDLRTSEALAWSYHRRGLLAVMYLRNVGADSSRRGPRDARIDRAEWERFKLFITVKRDAPAAVGDDDSEGEKARRVRPPKGVPRPEGSKKWLRRFRAAK